ncbi:sensor histidine kinase [uncultured Ilyobacter sp.]|uniref:sensor histidine kinase n=1 Tax=uncultured Ilyobacter sp. TaxID=544433 RepID=UPI0029C93F2F|nr:sensor histidine kinase [uncultured Ilyobacter sp.]
MLQLFNHLLNNIGYTITIAFFLSRLKAFRKIIEKEAFESRDKVILSLVFSTMAILGTYVGVDYNGAIANTRNIGVVVGGILGGPVVGITAGVIAGIHRVLIDMDGITAIPCGIATIIGGVLSGLLYKNIGVNNRKLYGFLAGVIVENISMAFILIMSRPSHLAQDIVRNIYVPMVLANALGVSIVIAITESIQEDKEKMAGEQSKLALEIANKTLPFFRELNSNSLKNVCRVIQESLGAKVVIITDQEYILANYSDDPEYLLTHKEIVSEATKKVLASGKLLVIESNNDEIKFYCGLKDIHSAIITPLKEAEKVVGTLKIYYAENSLLSSRNRYLAEGLSQLISTQLEISRIERLKEMAAKSELRALQAQINPHFLFNALHTVSSFVRMDPSKAREIIINLSTYLRFNIESGDKPVTLEKELEQVKAYVNIEQARFNGKINVYYFIEEEIKGRMIPSLIIQPLVENSIKHGILKSSHAGNVWIKAYRDGKDLKVEIEDDGAGIDERIIERINSEDKKPERIGLYNVHSRIKLLYGKGLEIERLKKGTKISFLVKSGREYEMYNSR